MGLSSIIFTQEPSKVFEVEGHKFVVKKLTARDSLQLDNAIENVGNEKADFKTMFSAFIDLLSVTIVEVDGIKAESKEDTKEFLLNLEQQHINEIFRKAQIFGEVQTDELKKSEGTPA